jgi:predicted negative regulator of RcsB-dependent stress response
MAKAPDLYVQQAKYWQAMTDVYEGKGSGAAFKDIQSALAGGKYSKLGPYVRLNLLCEVQRARAGDPDAGIKTLGDMIKKGEEDEATAAAYVAQGDLYRKQNKQKEAALSYMRAALLHPDQRESAAAGLYYASLCFKNSKLPNGPSYSAVLAGELKSKYPDYEPVAKKLFKN